MDEIKTMLENNNYKGLLNESDPYKIFAVDMDTSIEDITKKYKSFAKDYHPDRHANKSPQEQSEIALVFSKITSAFNQLKDPEERKRYEYEKDLQRLKEASEKKNSMQDFRNTLHGIDLRQTTMGNFKLNTAFTDNKIDVQELKKNKAELNFQNGKDKFNKNNLEMAIADFQAAIETDSKIAIYHTYLGLAMLKKGWNGYAMAEFKISLSLDPNDKLAQDNFELLNKAQEPEKKEPQGLFAKVKNIFKK